MREIVRLLKRINCDHNWVIRNIGNHDSIYAHISSKRCSKCKWVKHNINIHEELKEA